MKKMPLSVKRSSKPKSGFLIWKDKMKNKTVIQEDDCCTVKPEPAGGRKPSFLATWGRALLSFILLALGTVADNFWQPAFFSTWLRLSWYVLAYLPVGLPVIIKASKTIAKGDVVTEFFLMRSEEHTSDPQSLMRIPYAVFC